MYYLKYLKLYGAGSKFTSNKHIHEKGFRNSFITDS